MLLSRSFTLTYTSEAHADYCVISNFLDIPILSADHMNQLENAITQVEIIKAIMSMQSNKCPGPDGFLAKFFKKFSLLLSPLLYSVLAECC